MTFEAEIDADAIQQFADNARSLVEETKIHLDRDGISMVAVEPANVGMIEQSLSADAFAEYEATGGRIGVNLERLTDVLGMADDMVRLELDESTRKLHVYVDGLEYVLALIEPNSVRSEPDVPDLDLPGEAVIETADLKQAITATDMVSDHVSVSVDQNPALYFRAEGDTDDVTLTLDGDDLLDGTAIEEDAGSLLSLDYLKDIRMDPPADGEVVLHVGDDYPVTVEWRYADTEGLAEVTIAPRIGGGP